MRTFLILPAKKSNQSTPPAACLMLVFTNELCLLLWKTFVLSTNDKKYADHNGEKFKNQSQNLITKHFNCVKTIGLLVNVEWFTQSCRKFKVFQLDFCAYNRHRGYLFSCVCPMIIWVSLLLTWELWLYLLGKWNVPVCWTMIHCYRNAMLPCALPNCIYTIVFIPLCVA